ncbi:unnamed protein product [Pleuronectes platessa]|uniref:Uncharacterized protein n=1 Tax=Pleuronectes platessa TaxID=8262 RepID=A0A9N7Z7Y8_PLEPL|nr:unnamed protein product [Pleuronectes platessa]
MDGRGGGLAWDGLGWGLSRVERLPWPRGTLTQGAVDMDTLSGLNCGPLAAGVRKKRQEEEEDKGARKRAIHLSIHASTSSCILPSLCISVCWPNQTQPKLTGTSERVSLAHSCPTAPLPYTSLMEKRAELPGEMNTCQRFKDNKTETG